MRRMLARTLIMVLALGAVPSGPLLAQSWTLIEDDEWCDGNGWNERHCEVRELTIPADREMIRIDAGRNGGVWVDGWDRDEILIRARVTVWGYDEEEAVELASEVRVVTDGEVIHAEGFRPDHEAGWSVSYRVRVPERSNLDLEAHNGGIKISDVRGEIGFRAKNGGVSLLRVNGDVRGETKNGGVKIVLEGEGWEGEGMEVRTKNGGVAIEFPEDYSADLETSTVNGGIVFRGAVEWDSRIGKELRATLGDGGAPIRVRTKNGGVVIRES